MKGSKELRILFVEDDEDLRKIHAEKLQNDLNSTVIVAHSGNHAIEILETGSQFDFIVSDYRMPDGDGAKLLEYVTNKNLPVQFILFTNTIGLELPTYNKNFLGIIDKIHFKKLCDKIQKISH